VISSGSSLRLNPVNYFQDGSRRLPYNRITMNALAKGVPEGASVVIPRLFCRDPMAEIEFCTTVFDAAERVRRAGSDGKVAHALLTIGPAMLMVESEWPGVTTRAPLPDGSSPVVLYVYVPNVDETLERAVASGATVLMPLQNQYWGDRTAWIMDPSGHVWTIASRVEETTEAERQRRFESGTM
jgi:PhnB protein